MLDQRDQFDRQGCGMEYQVKTMQDKNEANNTKDEVAFEKLRADMEQNFKSTSDTLTVRMIIFTSVAVVVLGLLIRYP